jgi:hypothetical protein
MVFCSFCKEISEECFNLDLDASFYIASSSFFTCYFKIRRLNLQFELPTAWLRKPQMNEI